MEGNDCNGKEKKFDIFTPLSPPQRGWSGFQRLLLSGVFLLVFFLAQSAVLLRGKHRFTHPSSSSQAWLHLKALSLTSPVKIKENHLVL